MPRSPGIDGWIQIARMTALAGDMAPFPYIKGAAGCVVAVLEVIERAGKNDKDLQTLADDVGTTMQIMKETVSAHENTSATQFRDICAEFQTYLENLLTELDTAQRKLKRKGIKRFLKTMKISDAIDGYKQRMNTIKEDYVIRVTTDSRLAMSEMSTAITEATEASRLHIMSTVESRSDYILSEIRDLAHNQRENTSQICAKFHDMKGYYKGQVRELFPGDIYLNKLVDHSWYLPRFPFYGGDCTVENSCTPKFIRVYQLSQAYGMKQFHRDVDLFINAKHANIAQVFAVCRSPSFPAIVFHGTTRVCFKDHARNLTAMQGVSFIIELFHDLSSVSGYLANTFPRPETGSYTGTIYINELGKAVLPDILCELYAVGRLRLEPFEARDLYENKTPLSHGPLLSEISIGWVSSEGLPKEHLRRVYKALGRCFRSKHFLPNCEQSQPALGSILTLASGRKTLVGRVKIRQLEKWDFCWNTLTDRDCGFLPLTNRSLTFPLPLCPSNESTEVCCRVHMNLFPRDEILESWIAQASQLCSRVHPRFSGDNVEFSMIDDIFFILSILTTGETDSFSLYDTFMAETQHKLSLSIRPPVIDFESNTVSRPVISGFFDTDEEMTLEEMEEFFGIRVLQRFGTSVSIPTTILSTIPELNAEYGFDPARRGADVCECFGWRPLEVFDASKKEWTPLNAAVLPSESASAPVSDAVCQTLSEEDVSLRGYTMDMATERAREVQAGEALTTMKITTPVQRNMKLGCRELLIVTFTTIGTLLVSFIVHAYL